MAKDLVDHAIDGWEMTTPEVDTSPLQVTGRLSRIGAHLANRQEAVFDQFGLNRGEVGALSTLRLAGPAHRLSPGRMGKGLMLSSAGITSRIDRLERRGLVRRLPDPDDRRGVIVELTDQGVEVVAAAVAAVARSDAELLQQLDADEVATFERLLRKLLTSFELPG